jgi:hypothetical protein
MQTNGCVCVRGNCIAAESLKDSVLRVVIFGVESLHSREKASQVPLFNDLTVTVLMEGLGFIGLVVIWALKGT